MALILEESEIKALPPLMTPGEVAAFLQCSLPHAYELIHQNGLMVPLAGSRIVRVNRDAFLRYVRGE